MKAPEFRSLVRLEDWRAAVLFATLAMLGTSVASCSNDRPPPVRAVEPTEPATREPVVEAPKHVDTSTPYRAKLAHGGELYVPTWFSAHDGTYDVIVHFHGLGRLQEANLDRSQIDAAVVTINLGVGTDPYANAFRDPGAFSRLLAETEDEIVKSGRSPGSKLRRIALSAWSAGFVSVSKILGDPANAQRIDAVLLADGFFTSFTDVKKRTINQASLMRFVALADAASKNEKLFAITHSAIPTVAYPSVEETVAKLLEMTSSSKTASNQIGPRNMHETYVVDRGAFHVRGYQGVTAGDHIKQIRAMGETLYPYLKVRWEQPTAGSSVARVSAPSPR